MKRFSGFISIFSIALVLFLISMNQFGRIFDDEGNAPKPSWIEESQQQAGERNQFTFRKQDRETDTLRFEVTGDLVDSRGTGLDITNLDGPQALRDAQIRFPLQRSAETGADSLTPMTELLLRTGLIQYDSSHSRLKLIDGITGEGDDGTRFETSALDIRYDKSSRTARLSGVKPVRIEFPAVRIFGRGGFTGVIDTAQGLDQMRILPPVVVALDRSKGGGLLGIRQTDESAQGESARTSEEQIFLLGDGPLTINRAENRATFHDQVRIFEAPKTATIENPPEPGDTWFSCEELQLAFDSATLKFTGATALRGEELVTVHLPDSNKITAGRLRWLEGNGEVVLDEGVQGVGELVNFRSDEARLYSFQRRCELSGSVTAEFQRIAATDKKVNPRTLSRWKMTGTDRAALTWLERSRDRTERGRLESFTATAMIEHGLEIVENRENGARLVGTSLLYDGAGDTLRLVGSPREGASKHRPTFTEGAKDRNRIQAEEISLALTQPELVFTEAVDFVIHDFPEAVADPEVLPAWIRDRSEQDHALGTCHELRLLWDENNVLQRVIASADTDPRDGGAGGRRPQATPISFQLVGARDARLSGTRLAWAASDQQIRLRGLPGELDFQSGALTLAGEDIRFDTIEQTLDATDPRQVRLEVLERKLLKPDANEAGRTVAISSPNLHVKLAERAPAASESDAKSDPKERVTVDFARAWDNDGDFVEITDGVLVAMGQEVLWNAKQNELELKGEGRQRILHLEGDKDDELSAKSITVLTDKRQVILDGDVRGSIHQQPPHPEKTASGSKREDVPWRVEASSVTATLAEVPAAPKTGGQASDKSKLVLDEVDARGRIRVSSPDGSVSFEGSACSWLRSRQTLVIKDPTDDLALQTLRYGNGKDGQSDVRAREIRVTRNPGPDSSVETLWVFLTGDVVGNFQTAPAASGRSGRGKQVPTTMRLLAENLLAEFRPRSNSGSTSGKEPPLDLTKVSAWKGVNFLAGETCVLADRTVYTRSEETLVFSGHGRNKVQLIEKNVTSKSFDQLALRQRSDGRYTVKASGGEGLRGPEILKILEILEQREKAPQGE